MEIWCCGCEKQVNAKLVSGKEIYPHRPDLFSLPFWRCEGCLNYVGCHHKTKNRTRPLGCIPTPELKAIRKNIHRILDPIWKERGVDRGKLYAEISKRIGWEYHTAKIRTVKEAEVIYVIIKELAA